MREWLRHTVGRVSKKSESAEAIGYVLNALDGVGLATVTVSVASHAARMCAPLLARGQFYVELMRQILSSRREIEGIVNPHGSCLFRVPRFVKSLAAQLKAPRK